jgi:hypothetical protein
MKKTILTLVVSMAMIFFPINELECADWTHFSKADDSSFVKGVIVFFYDATSIEQTANGIYKVWVQIIKEAEIKQYQNLNRNITYNEVANSSSTKKIALHLAEINCETKMFRNLSMIRYKQDGSYLSSSDSASNWSNIAPDTISEALRKRICSNVNKN